jgi:diguanylate cyclase (GGDEF)-like protein
MTDPNHQFVRRVALASIALSVLAGLFAAALHATQEQVAPLDRVVPLAMAATLACIGVWSWFRPLQFLPSVYAAVAVVALAIVVPAWWYVAEAWRTPGVRLVDTLPPFSAALVPLTLGMIAFLPPRQALVGAFIAWLGFALPILLYLSLHSNELQTPRGQEIALTLGPVMLLVLAFIPLHRELQRRMGALADERARMQALAERDGLTGLYNRRAGESLLGASLMGESGQLELALFDIDHFKRINDGWGHDVGDAVLREVARRCIALLAEGEVVARWGGEEFLLLDRAPAGGTPGARAEALRRAIAATPFDDAGVVTASFGVVRVLPGEGAASLLKRADAALYEAKRGGRNRVVVAASG